MPTTTLPAIGSSPVAGFDLQPITYPAHLAQTRPPQPQDSTATCPSSPIPSNTPATSTPTQASASSAPGGTPGAAPAVPARSAHRYRDFTLGNSQAAFASAMNLTTSNLQPPASMSSLGINGSQSPAPPVDGGAVGLPSSSSTAAGTRRPSSSGGRKPTASAQGPASRSDRRGGDKDDPDSAEDGGKRSRQPSEGGQHVRRPPKARERGDANKATADDGEVLLAPILPAAKVARAPASSMYFSPVPAHGRPPGQALRAHTGTLVGDRIWFLGGVDARSCWRGVASFDTESLQWSTVETHGQALPPLRAHTTTLVGDQLYIFGGGDGPTYSNDVWVFDTITNRFSKPHISTPKANLPPPRRAHTTVLYRHFLVVFGGGNGQAALNDVWALDVSDPSRLTWHEWRTRGDVPQKKGYHTANLIGDKMIVFGGSDGHASFADVHVLNLQTMTWTLVPTEVKHNRLSHTSTQVGSYLFVIGGHNGQTYAQDVLLFNLTTLAWESKVPKGVPPPARGYHVAVLHDARIFLSGGYNGVAVFDDLWSLDLGAGAYLPQVTTFEVNEQSDHLRMMGSGPTKNGPSGAGGRI
ncbi:hypothetical protein CspHIS471_0305750 [Cutaneotrichosporon sp. HIS471]|nr:hypothetical protein CspHIS471_0305750 [Cutaneotrichosporon sp. HIS471]